MPSPSKSKVTKLERSRLDAAATRRELMHNDLDLEKLVVYLKGKIKFEDAGNVLEASVSLTCDGSNTLTIKLSDDNNTVLNSGLLSNKLDVQIDGIWFRLYTVGWDWKTNALTLVFEQREIAVMRTYNSLKFVRRSHATRAEFALNLVREVKEFRIPHVIPELHRVQPIEKLSQMPGFAETQTAKTPGIPPNYNAKTTDSAINTGAADQTQARGVATNIPIGVSLTVKGSHADNEQIQNANIICTVGQSMGMPRKIIVSAIMTAIVESTLHNVHHGDLDSLGLFQQRASWGSARDRLDPATSARMYYLEAKKNYDVYPAADPWVIAADTQRPREELRQEYAKYRTEGERFVNAYGIPGGAYESSAASANTQQQFGGAGADFLFYRGDPSSSGKNWGKENSWDCLNRLATEVNWRVFFVGGVFYWIAEDELMKSMPAMILHPKDVGIEDLTGDYNVNKKMASIDLQVRTGRWTAPPGSVVLLQKMGPYNGRWIVEEFDRSLFDSVATVTLAKPRPRLPEPAESAVEPPGGFHMPTSSTSADVAEAPQGESADLAAELLLVAGNQWKDDNGRGLSQIRKVASGLSLVSSSGNKVFMDPGPLRAVLWLINSGYTVGTYAWCEDHSDDGQHGHAGGYAVDISSLNGISINDLKSGPDVLAVLRMFNNATGIMHPRQLISGGYGNRRDITASSLSIPGSDSYYGAATMQQHTNHIHVGY